jgi:hypothetical protein
MGNPNNFPTSRADPHFMLNFLVSRADPHFMGRGVKKASLSFMKA